MLVPTHLRRSRHGIYYFRIVVPKAVRPVFGGRSEIKSSLRTRSLKVAMVEARRIAIGAYETFAKVGVLMSSRTPVDPSDPSTWPTTADGKFETTIETPTPYGVERFHVKADPNSPEDIAAAKAHASEYMANLEGRRIVPKTAEQAAYLTSQVDEIAALVGSVMDAKKQNAPQAVAAPAAAPRRVPQLRDSERYLGALFKRYLSHKRKSSLKTDKAANSYQNKFDVFIEWYGDAHIADVTPEDISRFKDYLLNEHEVQAGRNKGQRGLDATTVDNYLDPLSGLYKWARFNGSFPREMLPPTDGQRLMSKADKMARAQSGKMNRAFKTEELAKAFEPKGYREENRLSHHFWPPLIALFTGMRLNEVCQLACSDILMEEGLWAISINDEDYKKVKSAAARRTIPMHPELIAIGLPQFAADVKTLDLGPQLFPVLRPGDDGELGNAPGKKWDRYLKVAGLPDDALTYHSFRRTANTLLKKKKVPFDVRCQMVGHDLEHINEFYATDYTVADLAEFIFPKFVFEGLDLTALRYRSGEFNEAIRTGYAEAIEEAKRRAAQKERKEERKAKAEKEAEAKTE